MSHIILNTDSYKTSHYLQYPEGTQYITSYIEARGTTIPEIKETLFLGLQGFINKYLTTPIVRRDIDKAERRLRAHGVPFNRAGWEYIVDTHRGYLPIRIDALPEGSPVPIKNALVQITNTDPAVPWLVSYVETALLRSIWYPTTVGTISREIKKIIKRYLQETSDDMSVLDFMLHDFGARGVSSEESAMIGGFAHIVNFKGTDTLEAIEYAYENYMDKLDEMPAYSVIASEHSTMTAWQRDGEIDAYRNMLSLAEPNGIVACVSDSYDIYNACRNIWGGALREEVIALGEKNARLVIRPDSGDPTIVPIECVEILIEQFGCMINSKGYKVLPSYVRVLQGDGIEFDSLVKILENAKERGLSAENFVFGMGGGLLQKVNRDTFKFAMKATAITINGQQFDIYKDPITDPGKKSKRGVQAVIVDQNGQYKTIPASDRKFNVENQLQTVFENGATKRQVTMQLLRERAKV